MMADDGVIFISIDDNEVHTSAVWATCKVFKGQPFMDKVQYKRDIGIKVKKSGNEQASLFDTGIVRDPYELGDDGFENAQIVLDDEALLANIQMIQKEKNIKVSDRLLKMPEYNKQGQFVKNTADFPCLDVEMETGTGKTYVYIKTIFELNQDFGWSKFIIVVPSIANTAVYIVVFLLLFVNLTLKQSATFR